MTSPPPDQPPVDLRTVLGKVVAVLFAFRADDHGVSLAELARRTGMPKGTLHRVVGDLVQVRLLDKADAGYRLSGQVFQLGMRASVERGLLEVATPFMEDLYERTHETVHLGVLDEASVVYVAKIGGHRQATSPSRIGGRMPLHCTAIGKALLAHSPPELLARVVETGLARRTPRTVTAPGLLRRQLDRVAETGVAYEYEESAVGIVCVAAPVLDAVERPVAAISVTGPATRFRPEGSATAVKAAAAGTAAVLARRDAPH
ncbi:IclR family transcriptional regulator [Geodermatophilus sp. CPCC 206100]|uniref:IclR family transcriptional regulator n=1 Tax=Geodermatophilus sp. CPCC 206100 TaxID=3020054 RepID=UPI003AFF7947